MEMFFLTMFVLVVYVSLYQWMSVRISNSQAIGAIEDLVSNEGFERANC